MNRASEQDDEASPLGSAIRHRAVPWRQIGDKIVVARPVDGAPVVLAPTAAVVWRGLDDWTGEDGLDLRLAQIFPDIAASERESARSQILVALADDGLLERG